MDGLGQGEYPDARALPEPARRLHRKIQAAAKADRERKLRRKDVDETGRRWPGLNSKLRSTPPKR